MEHLYIIGLFIFLGCAIEDGLKKGLIVFLGWCIFWHLFAFISSVVGYNGTAIMSLLLFGCVVWGMLENIK